MFGRKPHLQIDILFGTNTAKLKGNTSAKYVENFKQRIEWAYKTAIRLLRKNKNGINNIVIGKSDVHN